MDQIVSIIGGGLAGCECACQLADRGVRVRLYEMRPHKMSCAHHTGHLAELVCSNSLKSLREDSAAGMLKRELTQLGSVLLELPKRICSRRRSVGGRPRRLCIIRGKQIAQRDRIEVIRKEVSSIPDGRLSSRRVRCVLPRLPMPFQTLPEAPVSRSSMLPRRLSKPIPSTWTSSSLNRDTKIPIRAITLMLPFQKMNMWRL